MPDICTQCPRECGVSRVGKELGFCSVPATFTVARIALHAWEEPSISGENGSGTIFFSGCNLRCVFCQNHEVSHSALGKEISPERLAKEMLRLQDMGAHNVNLVTPTQYAEQLIPVLERVKPHLQIPIVYNCGGYEKVETLSKLDGLVDIYLPDVKYFDADKAQAYSGAKDYFPVAMAALGEMLRQRGSYRFDENGLLQSGVIVRHLVLPGGKKDSVRLLGEIAARFGTQDLLLSLMSQYTPTFATACPYPELHRRITSFEYDTVLKEARRLGFEGYLQARTSATADFTPDFHETTFQKDT